VKRVRELDGIRGMAALAVVCFHLAPGYAPLGWVSVDCFFVLSGYLITTILLTNRDDPHYFFNFYVRRALRIWPVYYLTLLTVIIGYRYMPTNYPISAGIVLQYLTYTQAIQKLWFDLADRDIRAFGHTWTLAIEEQFYMLWPFAVQTLTRRGLLVLSVSMVACSVALRAAGMSWYVLPARCDGFALGSLLALIMSGRYASAENRGMVRNGMFITVVIAGATVAVSLWCGGHTIPTPCGTLRIPNWGEWVTAPINALFFGLIGTVILNAGSNWLAIMRWRPIVYLGATSYGLYLYHLPVLYAVEAMFRKFGSGHPFDDTRPFFRSIIELSITVIVASLSWRFVEKPILGLKDRFRYGVLPDAAIADGRPRESVSLPRIPLGAASFSALNAKGRI
jgi:peptidoglycan/LPS O-acetylase OafA/YrhL